MTRRIKALCNRIAPAAVLGLLLLEGACNQPLSSEVKLRALVEHEKKMDIILQDLQAECDSSVETTLRYRVDSLEEALNAKPLLAPKAKKSLNRAQRTILPHPPHHAHQEARHHHQHAQP
jgi:hypothetical protein